MTAKVEAELEAEDGDSRKKRSSSQTSSPLQDEDIDVNKPLAPLDLPETSEQPSQAMVGVSEEDIERWADLMIPPPRRFPTEDFFGRLDRETELHVWNNLSPNAYVAPQADPSPPSLYEEHKGTVIFKKGYDPFQAFYSKVGMSLETWIGDYWKTFDQFEDHVEAIEANITAEQKQAIVDRLGDWCLFHDWDSLMAHFTKKKFRLEAFAQVLICKDIFDSVVKNPFYYMDLEEDWDGRADVLPPPFGKQLFTFWQKLISIDEVTADEWRSSTVRNMNRYGNPDTREPEMCDEGFKDIPGIYDAENRTPGIRCHNIREAYMNQLVDNMLHKSSLLWLLRPAPDPVQESDAKFTFHRRGKLRKMYADAAEGALQIWASRQTYRFDENVKGIPPYKIRLPIDAFKLDRKTWHLSNPSENSPDSEAHIGRRAVMITWPTTWTINRQPREKTLAERLGSEYTEAPEWVYYNDLGWKYLVFCPGKAYFAGKGMLDGGAESEASAAPKIVPDENATMKGKTGPGGK